MRILLAHNSYQNRGGEDVVVENESLLLAGAGHAVERFTVDNEAITGVWQKAQAALEVVENPRAIAALAERIETFRPDVVHFHNIFPRLSVAAVAKVAERGIPAIMTAHNYRLVCAKATFERQGRICEDCLGRTQWPAIFHRCYRGSAIGSLSAVRMARAFAAVFARHPRQLTLIALTHFVKSKLIAGGFDPARIIVKGNAAADSGTGPPNRDRRFVFVGRLSHEKGADLLMRIAGRIDAEFEVIGDGPEGAVLARMAPANVTFCGPLAHSEVIARIKAARALLMPSRSYEGFPNVIVEAFSAGTPVIGSRLGAPAELIADGRTGLTVTPDDPAAWEAGLRRLLDDPMLARRIGGNARQVYEAEYSEARNLENLTAIYRSTMKRSKAWAK